MKSRSSYPTIAVVAGCGTLSSLGAIKLFECLESEQIPIDMLVGCSGGALACALWSSGLDAAKLFEELVSKKKLKVFEQLDYRTIMNVMHLPLSVDKSHGFIHSNRLQELYLELFGTKRVEDLRTKTIIQATNMETGQGVALEKGLLAEAAYASTALFPFLPPIAHGGLWLGDGGYSSPLPILEAVKRNPDIIIAISMHTHLKEKPKNYIDHIFYFLSGTNRTIEANQRALAIVAHVGEIVFIDVRFDRVIKLWDQHEIPYIFETCRQAVAKQKQEILDTIAFVAEKKRQQNGR